MDQRLDRAAFTLTELLVVVAIIVLLVVISIPIAQPLLKDRKVREASRQLNGFIVGAQARAAATGRPHGIWLERSDADPARCLQVFRAEVAPAYTGDTIGAVVKRIATTAAPGDYTVYFDANATLLPVLVRPGDRIKLDFRQPAYEIVTNAASTGGDPQAPPGSPFKIGIRLRTISDPAPVGLGMSIVSLPYQIYRQPTKSLAASLELPAELMIDLANSGVGASGREFVLTHPTDPTRRKPVVIMFAPSGAIDELYLEQLIPGDTEYRSAQPMGAVHLQIGKLANAQTAANYDPTDANSMTANMIDLTNLWVSIGHRTGSITSTENAEVNEGGLPANAAELVAKARAFAREKHAMGGR